MDAAASSFLIRLVSMGSSSFLQYASESNPWAPGSRQEAVETVRAVAAEERDEIARLTRWLQRRHFRVPFAGSYPSHFTTANFVSVDYLVPKLIAEGQREIAAVERDLHPIEDEEVHAIAEGYLAMKRRHLDTLRGLAPASV